LEAVKGSDAWNIRDRGKIILKWMLKEKDTRMLTVVL
jgi:hypothetical protein